MSNEPTRRTFVGGAIAGSAAAASLKPSLTSRSAARVIGSGDRIRMGVIGVGGNGTGMLRSLLARTDGVTPSIETNCIVTLCRLMISSTQTPSSPPEWSSAGEAEAGSAGEQPAKE